MKIAYIVRKYSTVGGTERTVYNLSKYFSEKGHDVTVICNKQLSKPPNDKIKIKKILNIPINRTIKTLWFYLMTKNINLNDYDIVQGCGKVVKQDIYRAGGGFHKFFIEEYKYGKNSNLKLYDKIVLKIEKELFNPKNTRYIISVSHALAKKIANEFNYPLKKIKIFHNAVDISFFNPINKYRDRKKFLEKFKLKENITLFLFVSNNFKLKGLYELYECIKQLDNCKLLVVGEDKFPNELKSDKIIFLGKKTGKDLLEIYHASDVLVHPTYFDLFSNVCLEGLACGLPVITTEINGASEVIENNIDGIIIKNPKDNKLFESMKMFIERKDIKELMSRNALKKAEQLSLEKYIDRLENFYFFVKTEKSKKK